MLRWKAYNLHAVRVPKNNCMYKKTICLKSGELCDKSLEGVVYPMYEAIIRQESTLIRRALEQIAHTLEGCNFFPHGACGNASVLLGEWLTRKGFKGVEYVSGSSAEIKEGQRGQHRNYFCNDRFGLVFAVHHWLFSGDQFYKVTPDHSLSPPASR